MIVRVKEVTSVRKVNKLERKGTTVTRSLVREHGSAIAIHTRKVREKVYGVKGTVLYSQAFN
jgi:hypothetical protein